jgi:hypothetical protein
MTVVAIILLNPPPTVADQADVLSCLLFNAPRDLS